MSAEGIWKVEMLGPYGWEAMSTAFLEDGTYRAGSVSHYATGTYAADDDKLTVNATLVLHKGASRTLFGQEGDRHEVRFNGRLAGDTASGDATDAAGRFMIRFRATRLAGL
jgi:hypothetical protein